MNGFPAGSVTRSPASPVQKALAGAALALLIGLALRVLFILVTPADVYSADMSAWQTVVGLLRHGQNPYQATRFLSWPPFWMQILFVLDKVAAAIGVSLFQTVRGFLLVCEGFTVFLTSLLLARSLPALDSRPLLIVGIALNPVAILLVCQHCNFDILVAVWILLFLNSQIKFQSGGDEADWLASCLFLGLGILTKTVPVVLAPILLLGVRRLTWKERIMGLYLLCGPAILALSVLYVLAPLAVETNVLGYRSFPGWFGITGLLEVLQLHALAIFYARASSWLFVAGLVWLSAVMLRRSSLLPSELVLLSLLVLMAVVIFGPGYGPQYISWFLPVLVASWAFWSGTFRVALVIFGIVASLTYIVEYALFPSHGMLAIRMGWSHNWLEHSAAWSTQGGQSLLRLPLFVAYAALFGVGVTRIRSAMGSHTQVKGEFGDVGHLPGA